MRKNAKLSDVLFYALQCAVQDRESYADACGRRSPEGVEALNDAALFRALSVRACGTSRSKLDDMIDNARAVPLRELMLDHTGPVDPPDQQPGCRAISS